MHACFNFFFTIAYFSELPDIIPYHVYIHKSGNAYAFSVNNRLAYSLTVIFEICFCKFQKENVFKNADADDKAKWS